MLALEKQNRLTRAQTLVELLMTRDVDFSRRKEQTNFERIRDIIETTPAFCGIFEVINNFVIPGPAAGNTHQLILLGILLLLKFLHLSTRLNVGGESVFDLMTMSRLRISIW